MNSLDWKLNCAKQERPGRFFIIKEWKRNTYKPIYSQNYVNKERIKNRGEYYNFSA